MNREEAKLILSAYRPGGQDAADTYFAEALALAQRDPELAACFVEQQRFDAEISRELNFLRAPLTLKSTILAQEKTPAVRRWSWLTAWNSPLPWALAAAVVILIALAALQFKPTKAVQFAFADFQKQMLVAAKDRTHHVEVESQDAAKIHNWLAGHQGDTAMQLPATLRDTPGLMGCRVVDWHGQKASMLCFFRDDTGHMDLFVAPQTGFADAPPATPQFAQLDKLTAVSWSRGGQVYLLIGETDAGHLQKLLAVAPNRVFPWLASAANPQKNFLE